MTDSPKPPVFATRATLLAASTLTVMAGATIAPSLPALRDHFAANPDADVLTRLVLTMPAVFIALAAPLAGAAIDRWGRRNILFAGLVLYALGGSSGLYLETLPGLLIGRAILGISVAMVMTTASALVADYFSGPARNRFFGHQAAAMGYGGVIFLLAGGFLADWHWRGPFGVYLASLILVPIAILSLPEPPRHQRQTGPGSIPEEPMPTRLKATIALVLLLGFVQMAAFYVIPVQFPFRLRELGINDPSKAGIAIATMSFFSATVSTRFAWIKGRLSHAAIFAAGFASLGLGYLWVWQATSYPMLIAGLVVAAAGLGMMMPNVSLWLAALAPVQWRGRVMGAMTTCVFLGQFASPFASQPLMDRFGMAGGFAACGVIMLGLSACFLPVLLRRHP